MVLSEIEPKLTPETNAPELLMLADRVVARYRAMLNEWDARGRCIDHGQVKGTRGRKAYAFPSPARRAEPKGWVLEAVSLFLELAL